MKRIATERKKTDWIIQEKTIHFCSNCKGWLVARKLISLRHHDSFCHWTEHHLLFSIVSHIHVILVKYLLNTVRKIHQWCIRTGGKELISSSWAAHSNWHFFSIQFICLNHSVCFDSMHNFSGPVDLNVICENFNLWSTNDMYSFLIFKEYFLL